MNIADEILSINAEKYERVLGKRPLWIVFEAIRKNAGCKCGWGIYAILKTKHEAEIELDKFQKHYGNERAVELRHYVPDTDLDPPLPKPPSKQGIIDPWHMPEAIQLVSAGFYFGWLIWRKRKGKNFWELFACNLSETWAEDRAVLYDRDRYYGTRYVIQKQIKGDRAIVRPADYFKLGQTQIDKQLSLNLDIKAPVISAAC